VNPIAAGAVPAAADAVDRALARSLPPRALPIDDDTVRRSIAVIETTGLVAEHDRWKAAERARMQRGPGGRPPTFSVEALLVAIELAAALGEPLLCTNFRDILFRRISPQMRQKLAVPEPPDADDTTAWEALYRNVRTRLHGFLELIDPSPRPKNHRLDPDDFEAAVAANRAHRALTDGAIAERFERLTLVANTIIEASIQHLPRDVRRRWKGSVAVDATPVPAWARGERAEKKGKRTGRKVTRYSADPDAGWYTHHQNGKPPTWAYEATLVVMCPDDPADDHTHPSLVVGMAPLHPPAVEPGLNAVRALTSVHRRGHPAGWLAGDAAYTNALAESFQLPVRAMGYEPVLDYRIDQLGVQGTHAGALLIEGGWYCPAIPKTLIDATKDHREGTITDDVYDKRIEERRKYRLRAKDSPDAEGHQRLTCPAAGHAPVARCELKPSSLTPGTAGKTRIFLTTELTDSPPTICSQTTVTFPPEAGSKLVQTLHYKSPEWAARYGQHRNTIEGYNGQVKDTSRAALAQADRRRVRGVAAQTLFAAFLIYATNLHRIRSFLEKACEATDGALALRRKPRPRRRRTRSLQDFAPTASANSPPAVATPTA
jgi:hypothetical protein